jgi:hypothetical protein
MDECECVSESIWSLASRIPLIQSKHSTLSSRAHVDLERAFRFRYSERNLAGIPLWLRFVCGAVHKRYTAEEWEGFVDGLRTDNRKG